ncbi:hypothetical protein SAMN04487859_107101 [Roseovarius lutimaris]|uniref:Uncharacterized protein n=1 Tax=Roseovarius lutimaris TaxID=1005928 RepID=A0A1I5B763_9RHOB|nr:hypothetical protein [Roseovarius lutimaris]SFN70542.1 hypothetical protein SAMN04487859_107101 [Roseovarius lutimaris]
MKLKNSIEKLDAYFERLESGKAQKIDPDHVTRVIQKLTKKREEVMADLAEASKPSKKERFVQKCATLDAQIERARWLLDQIG